MSSVLNTLDSRSRAIAGEVFDVATRKIVATLADETGAAVHSEKLLEIDFAGGVPVRAGDQFGIGRVVR